MEGIRIAGVGPWIEDTYYWCRHYNDGTVVSEQGSDTPILQSSGVAVMVMKESICGWTVFDGSGNEVSAGLEWGQPAIEIADKALSDFINPPPPPKARRSITTEYVLGDLPPATWRVVTAADYTQQPVAQTTPARPRQVPRTRFTIDGRAYVEWIDE